MPATAQTDSGRRRLLVGIAAGAWVAPQVVSMPVAGAQVGSPPPDGDTPPGGGGENPLGEQPPPGDETPRDRDETPTVEDEVEVPDDGDEITRVEDEPPVVPRDDVDLVDVPSPRTDTEPDTDSSTLVDRLPRTGGELLAWTAAGGALLGAGTATARAARHRADTGDDEQS